jgi:hypothetical protein
VAVKPGGAMSRNNNDEVDWEEYQIFDGGNRRFVKRDVDEPKRSPIRRKYKMRSEKEMKPKPKRNHRKVLQRFKYEWKDD